MVSKQNMGSVNENKSMVTVHYFCAIVTLPTSLNLS